jgi:hypothetical protein
MYPLNNSSASLHSPYRQGLAALLKASPSLISVAFLIRHGLISYLYSLTGMYPGPSHLIIPIRPFYSHVKQVTGLIPDYFFINCPFDQRAIHEFV